MIRVLSTRCPKWHDFAACRLERGHSGSCSSSRHVDAPFPYRAEAWS